MHQYPLALALQYDDHLLEAEQVFLHANLYLGVNFEFEASPFRSGQSLVQESLVARY